MLTLRAAPIDVPIYRPVECGRLGRGFLTRAKEGLLRKRMFAVELAALLALSMVVWRRASVGWCLVGFPFVGGQVRVKVYPGFYCLLANSFAFKEVFKMPENPYLLNPT